MPRYLPLLALALFACGLMAQQAPAGAEDPTILAAGDIACGPNNVKDPCRDEDTAALLSNLAAVLPLGDNQYEIGALGDFQAVYDKSWGAYKPQTFPVPGNHEYKTLNAAGYYDYFGAAAGDPQKGYYSLNLGDWHLIALNSACNTTTGRGVPGGCGGMSPMVTWLKQDLAADNHTCELAFFHHPRFSSETPGKRPMGGAWNKGFMPNGVDVVLNGHSHNYERFAPQNAAGSPTDSGVRQFVVGTGGKNTRPIGPDKLPTSQVSTDTTFGVLKLTLHSLSYSWDFIPVAGQSFSDSGSTDCH